MHAIAACRDRTDNTKENEPSVLAVKGQDCLDRSWATSRAPDRLRGGASLYFGPLRIQVPWLLPYVFWRCHALCLPRACVPPGSAQCVPRILPDTLVPIRYPSSLDSLPHPPASAGRVASGPIIRPRCVPPSHLPATSAAIVDSGSCWAWAHHSPLTTLHSRRMGKMSRIQMSPCPNMRVSQYQIEPSPLGVRHNEMNRFWFPQLLIRHLKPSSLTP